MTSVIQASVVCYFRCLVRLWTFGCHSCQDNPSCPVLLHFSKPAESRGSKRRLVLVWKRNRQQQSGFVLQPWLTRVVLPVKWLQRHVNSVLANEVFIWEVGRVKSAGPCPWIPSVRIPETLEVTHSVPVWQWEAEVTICQSVNVLLNIFIFILLLLDPTF